MDDNTKPSLSLALIVLSLVLLAINMRSPIVMIGSLAQTLESALSLSTVHIGYLGALPLPLFAVGALFAPRLASRFGLERVILAMIACLSLAVAARVWFGVLGLFVGTFVLAFAIGLLNVLIAPFIKKYAADHIALTTGIFSLSMSVCAGLLAWVVVPVVEATSWQVGLSLWAVFGALAFLVWGVMLSGNTAKIPNHDTAKAVHLPKTSFCVWRCPDAYFLAVFFGVQSLLFYSVASFLPSVGMGYGMSIDKATGLALIFQIMAPVAVLVLTYLMKKNTPIKPIAVVSALFNVVGAAGLLWLPHLLALWSAFLGFGGASIFTLTLMLFSLRTTHVQTARDLSGMVQSIGYVIALFGPLLLGFLFDKTGTWQLPLQVLLLLMVINVGFAFLAGKGDKVDQNHQCLTNSA